MARFLELVFVLLAVLFVIRFLRQVFKATPPDDRGEPEGRMAMAGTDGPRKPPPSSIKLDLSKDPD
jgi:hypothetical protein